MAFRNLYITDFDHLVEQSTDATDIWESQTPLDAVSAYDQMLANCDQLKQYGALLDGSHPFNRVSGFAIESDEDYTQFPGIKSPAELDSSRTLKFLMWGSPHPNASSSNSDFHGSNATSSVYKTNAFESMAWLAPSGSIFMAFPEKYRVEMYQPMHDLQATNRILVCGKMLSRYYTPMASGNGMRFPVPGSSIDGVMVSMLLLPEHMKYLTMVGDRIDFGSTAFKILNSLSDTEFGVALGVYDLSLEMELFHAMEIHT